MKTITCYQTKDGKTHIDKEAAILHADHCYGKALHQLSLVLDNCNYSGRKIVLSDNLDLLRDVITCKDDMEVEPDENT